MRPYIKTIERFASATGLLPEQVWDQPDVPSKLMYLGMPTGSAMPLMWAHAEYIKLLRSARDGKVFDLIAEVAGHFRTGRRRPRIEVWKFNRQIVAIRPGATLRVLCPRPFALHWTLDEWSNKTDSNSKATVIGLHYVDIAVSQSQQAPVKFTFRWLEDNRWEGKDFEVRIRS